MVSMAIGDFPSTRWQTHLIGTTLEALFTCTPSIPPASLYATAGMEVPARDFGINLQGRNYIVLQGFADWGITGG